MAYLSLRVMVLVALLCLSGVNAEILVNEIDYVTEWIEIFNQGNEFVNLEGWYFEDARSRDTMECCEQNCSLVVGPGEYVVLAGSGNDLDFERIICVDDRSLGNGLSNKGDLVRIGNGSYYSEHEYTGSGNGKKTLERRNDGSWGISLDEGGTPNNENSIALAVVEYRDLEIGEVMANPFGTGSEFYPYGEWVELYNAGDVVLDLRGLEMRDQDDSHEIFLSETNVIGGVLIGAGERRVVYRNGDSDFSLNDNGYDEVRLFLDEDIIDEMSYSGSVEGMSWSKVRGEWVLTKATKGEENIFVESCDWKLNLEMDDVIFADGASFTIRLEREFGEAQIVSGTGWIEDINGVRLREYVPWNEQRVVSRSTRTYSPRLKEGPYKLHFEVGELGCRDEDLSNNVVERFFGINDRYGEGESQLKIENVVIGSDGEVEWGEQFNARVSVYRGNSTKRQVKAYVEMNGERVSRVSSVNLEDGFREYTLTIPVVLETNCGGKIDGGNAKVVVEGLDLQDEKSLRVEGFDRDVCERVEIEVSEKSEGSGKFSFDLVDLQEEKGEVRGILRVSGDKEEHTLKLWGYAYRGSKCYSCSGGVLQRDNGVVQFDIAPFEVVEREVLLEMDEGLAGDFKVKFLLNKDSQKTSKEVTREISISDVGKEVGFVEQNLVLVSGGEGVSEDRFLGGAVEKKVWNGSRSSPLFIAYESSSRRAEKLVPEILALAFGLLVIIQMFVKK